MGLACPGWRHDFPLDCRETLSTRRLDQGFANRSRQALSSGLARGGFALLSPIPKKQVHASTDRDSRNTSDSRPIGGTVWLNQKFEAEKGKGREHKSYCRHHCPLKSRWVPIRILEAWHYNCNSDNHANGNCSGPVGPKIEVAHHAHADGEKRQSHTNYSQSQGNDCPNFLHRNIV